MSLSNDLKLNNSVLIGLSNESRYSLGAFLDQFQHTKKIHFEGVLIDRLKTSSNKMISTAEDEDDQDIDDSHLEKFQDVQSFFKDMSLKFTICADCSKDPNYLIDRSAVYDLFCVGNEVLEKSNATLLKYFYNLNCPVLIIPENFEIKQNLLFVFDGTAASIRGLKRFIKLFANKIMDATVTALIINDGGEKRGFNEKVIVDFLLANFIDVGVVTTSCEHVEFDIKRLISGHPNSILLTGILGFRTIISRKLSKLIKSNNIPFFFSN